jgi:hypothetical protein
MLVPIQDIQGLVYNEYINMDNALKIVKTFSNWYKNDRKQFQNNEQN